MKKTIIIATLLISISASAAYQDTCVSQEANPRGLFTYYASEDDRRVLFTSSEKSDSKAIFNKEVIRARQFLLSGELKTRFTLDGAELTTSYTRTSGSAQLKLNNETINFKCKLKDIFQ